MMILDNIMVSTFSNAMKNLISSKIFAVIHFKLFIHDQVDFTSIQYYSLCI